MTKFTIETANRLFLNTQAFAVPFDNAWEWLEFSTKGHALESFKSCQFKENTHYIVKTQESSSKGGRPEKLYFLTLECFKHWGMMSRTEAGVTIRDYFIECERIARSKFTEDLKSIEKFGNFAKAWEIRKDIQALEKRLDLIYKKHPEIRLAFAQLSVSEDLEKLVESQKVDVRVRSSED
jgi:phage anti-repressor protein